MHYGHLSKRPKGNISAHDVNINNIHCRSLRNNTSVKVIDVTAQE